MRPYSHHFIQKVKEKDVQMDFELFGSRLCGRNINDEPLMTNEARFLHNFFNLNNSRNVVNVLQKIKNTK